MKNFKIVIGHDHTYGHWQCWVWARKFSFKCKKTERLGNLLDSIMEGLKKSLEDREDSFTSAALYDGEYVSINEKHSVLILRSKHSRHIYHVARKGDTIVGKEISLHNVAYGWTEDILSIEAIEGRLRVERKEYKYCDMAQTIKPAIFRTEALYSVPRFELIFGRVIKKEQEMKIKI